MISLVGIVGTALVAITTAKVNSHGKSIQKVEDDVKSVKHNVVNSHTESVLRDDIDNINTKLVGISTLLGEVMELQATFSKSLVNRTRIYESMLAEAMASHVAESREEFREAIGEITREHKAEVARQIEEFFDRVNKQKEGSK